ncbi:MAG: hypothetical protein EAZ89_09130 [Bacteroidetes bacterium]|nr:MAG: hypothetical protein EAZ89_09130 [Bacteroidota bacterium]
MKHFFTALWLVVCAWSPVSVSALVKYDEGRLFVKGFQLLQDLDDPLAYYYIPQYPRLATHADGSYELLFIKYVGKGGPENNGGLFHALIEFSLDAQSFSELEKELQKVVSGAKLVGPVPLQEAIDDGEEGLSSFQIVSSVLNNTTGKNALTSSVVTSGHAPFLPGSKAAVAAKLSQEGATLLWETFQRGTSDVSVSLSGVYEAYVKAYNAVITADVSTIYTHFSQIYNEQEGFKREQIRDITDKLVQNQMLKVDVFDRSAGLGVKANDMDGILTLVTNKIIELMFDSKTGWAQKPTTEVAVEQNQIPMRQERGFFANVFGGHDNAAYVTDEQFVMKKRTDIRIQKFYLNLGKATTIKVPVYTSGNLSGLYGALKERDRYFQVVNLDDPDFQKRDVNFQVDGSFTESYKDVLNFTTVSFRKIYGDGKNDVTGDLVFRREDLEKGVDFQAIQYPRLGSQGADWLNYEYRVSWSIKGDNKTIKVPAAENQWISSKEPSIALTPPFKKKVIEIDADRSLFKDAGYRSATIRFFVVLAGKAQPQKTVILRVEDASSIIKTALYHDANEPLAYQITWYGVNGKKETAPQELKEDYLFILPPQN